MKASLVYDGGGITIPSSMGFPAEDQMLGTSLERLGELASRICYDSLGYDEHGKKRGRSSGKLHEHILQVINLSVYAHCNFTVVFEAQNIGQMLIGCLNRKGIWIESPHDQCVEITANLRAVLEWEKWTGNVNDTEDGEYVGKTLTHFAHQVAPQIVKDEGGRVFRNTHLKDFRLSEHQAWVSLYMYGSRGFTHEQVRHNFAVSQRSTRYVDEDESDYVMHPLVEKYLHDEGMPFDERHMLAITIGASMDADRKTYKQAVKKLEAYGLTAGLDKQTARKQARGAARGYLGNALASEMIFSAPVSGWKWMLSQRLNKFADAEIRGVYSEVLPALKASRHGWMFDRYDTVASPDGLGVVLG